MPHRNWIVPALATLLVVAAVTLGWTGYYGSDDMSYAAGGLGWLHHFPYVGVNHWTLRHTVVIPMAALFGVFGVSELTLVLPVTIYYGALLMLVFFMMRLYFDTATASVAAMLLGTLPLTALAATTVVPDLSEVFFCLLSLSLFFEATRPTNRRVLLLILAGVAAGFSWLTRETVVFFLITYGALFLVGYGVPRRYYFLMAAGFLGVVGIELLYFTLMTGDPLYRVHTDIATHLGGNSLTGDKTAAGIEHNMGKVEGEMYGPLSRTGSLSIGRFIDPILVILANQEFMLLYYLAVPTVTWMVARHRFEGEQQAFLRVFGLSAALWFVCLYLQLGMTLLPRYYLLPTTVLIMAFAVWFRNHLWPRSTSLAIVLLMLLLSANFVGIYVDNKNPVFGERSLVDFLQQTDETVLTDPETARRGSFLFDIAGVGNRIVAGPPEPGKLYFFNPKYVTFGAMSFDRSAAQHHLEPYRPKEDWPIVWHKEPERRWIGNIIDGLGLTALIPKEVYRRLVQPNFPVTVYRP